MLDDIPMSSFQIWSVLMIAATVILDGLDNQMLGLAAPSLLKEWDISREALGSVFALGFVGMTIGTLCLLQLLVAVVEVGSITGAAQRLGDGHGDHDVQHHRGEQRGPRHGDG